MADITLADVERAVKTTATTVLRNEHYFLDLDGLAGDGDFGTSLATGFRVIDADLPTIDKSAIGAMLLKISMLCSSMSVAARARSGAPASCAPRW